MWYYTEQRKLDNFPQGAHLLTGETAHTSVPVILGITGARVPGLGNQEGFLEEEQLELGFRILSISDWKE